VDLLEFDVRLLVQPEEHDGLFTVRRDADLQRPGVPGRDVAACRPDELLALGYRAA
jgi:hypothetical protein